MAPQSERPGSPVTTRREFCTRACQFASLAAVGMATSRCGGSPTGPGGSLGSLLPVLTATSASGALTLSVDAGSPLATVGSAALIQSSSGNYLVARTAQTTFVALTAICTHQTCTITNFSGSLYVCPCHGSEYNLSGQVVQGPAPQSLRQFATQFTDPTLTISL